MLNLYAIIIYDTFMTSLQYTLTKALTECFRNTFSCFQTSWSYLYHKPRPWEILTVYFDLSKSSISDSELFFS